MIYTYGHEKTYSDRLAQYGHLLKKGKDDDYLGGIVFYSRIEAERRLPDSEHVVWGVLADWERDTEWCEKYQANRLLVSSPIVDIRGEPPIPLTPTPISSRI